MPMELSSGPPTDPGDGRRMSRATLMGRHSHRTSSGVELHIYIRDGKYLARGSLEGRRIGPTIGSTELEAEVRLREILVDIERGTYLRPSEARNRPLKIPQRQATFRQIADQFLVEKRNLLGKKTFANYRSRLGHVLDFIDLPANRK